MLSMLTLLGGCVLVIVGCVVMQIRQDRKNAEKYEWQPDLSHNVVEYNTVPRSVGGHSLMTTLPKSQEQLDEEKRTYLKERKSYD